MANFETDACEHNIHQSDQQAMKWSHDIMSYKKTPSTHSSVMAIKAQSQCGIPAVYLFPLSSCFGEKGAIQEIIGYHGGDCVFRLLHRFFPTKFCTHDLFILRTSESSWIFWITLSPLPFCQPTGNLNRHPRHGSPQFLCESKAVLVIVSTRY